VTSEHAWPLSMWSAILHVFSGRCAAVAVRHYVPVTAVPKSIREFVDRDVWTDVTARDLKVLRNLASSIVEWREAGYRVSHEGLAAWHEAVKATRESPDIYGPSAVREALEALRQEPSAAWPDAEAELRRTIEFIGEVTHVACVPPLGPGRWLEELRHEEWRSRPGLVLKVWALSGAPDLEVVEDWAAFYRKDAAADWTPEVRINGKTFR